MLDNIINGDGNSRYLKSSIASNATWADALALLRAGTFPIDLNGINQSGFSQVGTPLNKATILTDALAQSIGLTSSATLVDFLNLLKNSALLNDGADDANYLMTLSLTSTGYPALTLTEV